MNILNKRDTLNELNRLGKLYKLNKMEQYGATWSPRTTDPQAQDGHIEQMDHIEQIEQIEQMVAI